MKEPSRASLAVVPFAIVVFLGVLLPAQEPPLPDFNAFTAQVKQRLQTDAALQAGYTFTERRVEQKLNASGQVVEEHVKVFEVYPPLPGEEPYRRLIEEDGTPVPAAVLEKRDSEHQKKAEEYARDLARQTESDRQKAVREYEKAMKERAADIDDIFNVFDARMTGRATIDGHQTITFTLTPKPKAKPRTDSGKVMQHFSAKVWISEAEYELVRVEVEAVDTVTFGFGLLARLHEGATLTYQRRKVNGEAWLPSRVTYAASGRLLLVRRLRLAGSSEFSKYRKFSVDTTTTLDLPAP